MTTRREFLKSMTAAAAMVGAAGAPKFSFAQEAGGKTFIKIFMRGGADGLHLFPLYSDPFYREYRPDLSFLPPGTNDPERATAIDLGPAAGGTRGLNPNLELLTEIWDSGRMMIAPATSFAGANRSHFDCQRWIGTGARNNIIDGYLNRYMQNVPGPDHPLRGAVAGKTGISTELRGTQRVPAIRSAGSFEVENRFFCNSGCADNQLTDLMREISSHEVDFDGVEGEIRENQVLLVDTIAEVQAAGTDYSPSAGEGFDYSDTDLGRGLRLCAQLLKADVPLEVAALDWNIGWDTHSNQINSNQDFALTNQNHRYNERLTRGARDFVVFWRDMAAMRDDIVVLVGSEFGRTKKQNGSFGTDHGEGGAWFAFGGPTQQAVADDVTTIDDAVIDRNWLPTVTSYRNIVGEIMVRHMGMSDQLISTIFPNHSFDDYSLFRGTSS